MKRLVYGGSTAQYFPGVGLDLVPGLNRVGDDHAVHFLKLAGAGVPVRLATAEECAKATADEHAAELKAREHAHRAEKAAAKDDADATAAATAADRALVAQVAAQDAAPAPKAAEKVKE